MPTGINVVNMSGIGLVEMEKTAWMFFKDVVSKLIVVPRDGIGILW